MDTLKKIIHPHKADHGHDSTTHSTVTTTDQQHSSKLRGSDTGDNLANPFSEPIAQAAESFRQHGAAGAGVGTNHPHHTSTGEAQPLGRHADSGTAHAYGTGVGAAVPTGQHEGHTPVSHGATGGAGARVGTTATGSTPQLGDSYGPGVNTGGAEVVDARMPEEQGNNFPGTNPAPAHNALGTAGEGGGLKYPGGQ